MFIKFTINEPNWRIWPGQEVQFQERHTFLSQNTISGIYLDSIATCNQQHVNILPCQPCHLCMFMTYMYACMDYFKYHVIPNHILQINNKLTKQHRIHGKWGIHNIALTNVHLAKCAKLQYDAIKSPKMAIILILCNIWRSRDSQINNKLMVNGLEMQICNKNLSWLV